MTRVFLIRVNAETPPLELEAASSLPQSVIPPIPPTPPALVPPVPPHSGMENAPSREQPLLTWSNVALALSFVAFDTVLSSVYRLGISGSLISAASRCVIQLSVMALVLDSIFQTKSPYGIAALARESHHEHWLVS